MTLEKCLVQSKTSIFINDLMTICRKNEGPCQKIGYFIFSTKMSTTVPHASQFILLVGKHLKMTLLTDEGWLKILATSAIVLILLDFCGRKTVLFLLHNSYTTQSNDNLLGCQAWVGEVSPV